MNKKTTRRRKRPKIDDIVCVIWKDACLHGQVTNKKEATVAKAISFGVLLENTKKQIKLAHTIWDTGQKDIITIPKTWATKIILLQETGFLDKE